MAYLPERYSGNGDELYSLHVLVFSRSHRADPSNLVHGNLAATL